MRLLTAEEQKQAQEQGYLVSLHYQRGEDTLRDDSTVELGFTFRDEPVPSLADALEKANEQAGGQEWFWSWEPPTAQAFLYAMEDGMDGAEDTEWDLYIKPKDGSGLLVPEEIAELTQLIGGDASMELQAQEKTPTVIPTSYPTLIQRLADKLAAGYEPEDLLHGLGTACAIDVETFLFTLMDGIFEDGVVEEHVDAGKAIYALAVQAQVPDLPPYQDLEDWLFVEDPTFESRVLEPLWDKMLEDLKAEADSRLSSGSIEAWAGEGAMDKENDLKPCTAQQDDESFEIKRWILDGLTDKWGPMSRSEWEKLTGRKNPWGGAELDAALEDLVRGGYVEYTMKLDNVDWSVPWGDGYFVPTGKDLLAQSNAVRAWAGEGDTGLLRSRIKDLEQEMGIEPANIRDYTLEELEDYYEILKAQTTVPLDWKPYEEPAVAQAEENTMRRRAELAQQGEPDVMYDFIYHVEYGGLLFVVSCGDMEYAKPENLANLSVQIYAYTPMGQELGAGGVLPSGMDSMVYMQTLDKSGDYEEAVKSYKDDYDFEVEEWKAEDPEADPDPFYLSDDQERAILQGIADDVMYELGVMAKDISPYVDPWIEENIDAGFVEQAGPGQFHFTESAGVQTDTLMPSRSKESTMRIWSQQDTGALKSRIKDLESEGGWDAQDLESMDSDELDDYYDWLTEKEPVEEGYSDTEVVRHHGRLYVAQQEELFEPEDLETNPTWDPSPYWTIDDWNGALVKITPDPQGGAMVEYESDDEDVGSGTLPLAAYLAMGLNQSDLDHPDTAESLSRAQTAKYDELEGVITDHFAKVDRDPAGLFNQLDASDWFSQQIEEYQEAYGEKTHLEETSYILDEDPGYPADLIKTLEENGILLEFETDMTTGYGEPPTYSGMPLIDMSLGGAGEVDWSNIVPEGSLWAELVGSLDNEYLLLEAPPDYWIAYTVDRLKTSDFLMENPEILRDLLEDGDLKEYNVQLYDWLADEATRPDYQDWLGGQS